MLVIEDSEYRDRVPIQLGTLHIDMILGKATPKQLAQLGKTYKQGEVGRPIQSKYSQICERIRKYETGKEWSVTSKKPKKNQNVDGKTGSKWNGNLG